MKRHQSFIIMMRGFTASGKSTLARYLAKNLKNTEIFHTAEIRKELNLKPDLFVKEKKYNYDLRDEVFVSKISPLVYNEMIKSARKSLFIGKNVILDGTYNFIWQRKKVSDLCKETGSKLYIIKCVCSSEAEIKKRLETRKLHSKNPLNEASSWSTYISTRDFSDDISPSEFYGTQYTLIEYDSFNNKLNIIEHSIDKKNDENFNAIYNTVKKIKDHVHL